MKIKAENLSKERYNCDLWVDIVGTKRTYDTTINGNVVISFIQTLVRETLIIHMFTEEQINLLKTFLVQSLFTSRFNRFSLSED